jgi:hypothetical protein
MTRRTSARRRALLAAGIALGLATLTGACAQESAGPEVATIEKPTDGGTPGTTAAVGTKDPKEAALEFARCMREHGIDMPDPDVSDEGRVAVRIGPGGGDPNSPAMKEARQACEPAFEAAMQEGRPKLDPEEEARRREDALAFVQCMRDHGIDMPDPEFGDGGMRIQRGPAGTGDAGTDGPDPDSPAFQEAHEACSHLLGDRAKPGLHRDGPEKDR